MAAAAGDDDASSLWKESAAMLMSSLNARPLSFVFGPRNQTLLFAGLRPGDSGTSLFCVDLVQPHDGVARWMPVLLPVELPRAASELRRGLSALFDNDSDADGGAAADAPAGSDLGSMDVVGRSANGAGFRGSNGAGAGKGGSTGGGGFGALGEGGSDDDEDEDEDEDEAEEDEDEEFVDCEDFLQAERPMFPLASLGLSSFVVHNGSEQVLVRAHSGHVLRASLGSRQPEELVPGQSDATAPDLDPKWSPDGRFVALVRNRDIHLVSVASRVERRVTFVGSEDPRRSAGTAEFIIQEEFGRNTGYWWSPVIHPGPTPGSLCYHLAYFEVDESKVPARAVTGDDGTSESKPYPRPGEVNASTEVRFLEITVYSDRADNFSVSVHRPDRPIKAVFPWLEYVPRCDWLPDGSGIWMQLMDRSQRRLALVVVPLAFAVPDTRPGESAGAYRPFTIVEEQSADLWINTSTIVHFWPDGSPQLLWSSERDGFRHLYMVRYNALDGQVLDNQAITTGPWAVLSLEGVDHGNEVAYVVATKDSPIERHLYAVSFSAQRTSPNNVRRVTDPGYFHLVEMSADASHFVTSFSNLHSPPRTAVFRIRSRTQPLASLDDLAIEEVVEIEHLAHPNNDPVPVQAPELIQFRNREGTVLFGALYLPREYQSGVRYRTLVYVYGGPQAQYVHNSYKLTRWNEIQLFAARGFVVLVVDGRGSFGRGLAFESQIHNRMGTVECQDQIDGVQYLVQLGVTDPARVAIYGWSYGGFLALRALAKHGDVFKAAIAGAAVTRWDMYTSGYTERYMGMFPENEWCYLQSSVVPNVHGLPDTPGRLLLVHGLLDDNVHVAHTMTLIQALVSQGKPYALKLYPKERHGLRHFEARLHNSVNCVSFLEAAL